MIFELEEIVVINPHVRGDIWVDGALCGSRRCIKVLCGSGDVGQTVGIPMHHIYHSSGGTLLAWKSLLFFWQPLLLLPSLSPSSSHVLTSGTPKDVGHLMARNIVSQKMRGCPKVPPASRSPSKAVFIVVILSQSVSQSVICLSCAQSGT
jgi:hypothetical protein